MGRIVTQQLERVFVFAGNNRELGVFDDDMGGIDQFAVDLARQRRLGQPRTDRLGHGHHRDRMIEFARGTIR